MHKTLRQLIRQTIQESSSRKAKKEKLPPLETSAVLSQWTDMLRSLHGLEDPESGEIIDIEQWLGSDLFGSDLYPGGLKRRQSWNDPEDPYPKGAALLIVRNLATDSNKEIRDLASRILGRWNRLHSGFEDNESMKIRGDL